jgi:hypothetical protein
MAALLCGLLLANCKEAVPSDFHGVKLGFAARDVRARFTEPGTWESETNGGTALVWKRSDAGTPRTARFEFHNGMLVAVRSGLYGRDPRVANGGQTLQSETSVYTIARSSEAGIYTLRWIAKDCPEHAEEVRGIMGK